MSSDGNSSDLFSGSIIGLVSPVSGSNSILNRFSTSVPFFQNMTGAMTLEKNAMSHLHLRDESDSKIQSWIFEVKFFIEKYRGIGEYKNNISSQFFMFYEITIDSYV